MSRGLYLSLLAGLAMFVIGCGGTESGPAPKPTEATGRPRPDASGNIPKDKSVPKGVMKPVAD